MNAPTINAPMILRGRVAALLGDNVDTDLIYPGRFLNITDRAQTAEHLFELAWPEIRANLKPGDFIVAGRNFGCGSSREQAAAAIKYSGVGAVIAISFARIFYRNAINLGLPALVLAEPLQRIQVGEELEVDLGSGGGTCRIAPLDPRAIELLQAGGLVPYLKAKHAA